MPWSLSPRYSWQVCFLLLYFLWPILDPSKLQGVMETFFTLAVVSLLAALAFLLYGGRYVHSYLPYEQMHTRYLQFFCFHHSFFCNMFGDLSLINTLFEQLYTRDIPFFCFHRSFICNMFWGFTSHQCTVCLLVSSMIYLVCICFHHIQFSQGKAWALAF